MTDKDWELRPLEGLGPLEFGMSEEVSRAVAAGPFGDIEAEGPVGQQSDEEAFQILVETMGEEAAREAMGVLEADGISFRSTRRVNYLSGLMLDFVEDRLDMIMCHGAADALHIGGKKFFGVDPFPALRRLQAVNGELPLVKGPDCHFRQVIVTAFEFILPLPAGLVRATREGTDETQQKTLGWRATPRLPDEDFSGHVLLDLG